MEGMSGEACGQVAADGAECVCGRWAVALALVVGVDADDLYKCFLVLLSIDIPLWG